MASTLCESEKAQLASNSLGDLDIWKGLYRSKKNDILKNVHLSNNGQLVRVDAVEFHPKFGWTLYGERMKAYLGKSSIYRNVRIEIGHRTYFSGHSSILGDGIFRIGNYCAVAENLYANVQPDFHPFNYPSLYNFRTENRLREDNLTIPLTFNGDYERAARWITIGNDVWIARNVRIFNGITIGNGCVVAEGSLINKDCEPYGIYAGIPAKLIRYRFKKEIINDLLEIAWWYWPENKIHENSSFFDTDLTKFDGNVKDLL
jgi:virginiamycin A acetyltransferase